MQEKKIKTKIMVFGTFDGLHSGHLNFLKQARALKSLVPGQARKLTQKSFLIVSVARDKNVRKIKGNLPGLNEKKRIALVKKCRFVDKVILSGIKNHLPHIIKERPDIIALGYDQKAYIDKRGSRGRVLSHTASESKSHQGNPYIKNLKKDLKNKDLLVKIIRLKPYKEKIYKNHLLKIKR